MMNPANREVRSTQRRRATGKEKVGSRKTWKAKEEEVLVNTLKSILTNGWKCENGFYNGYLLQLEVYMLNELPNSDIRTEPHINSNIHVWKKQYSTLASMMRQSGFGWDKTQNIITVDDNSIWDDYVKMDPSAKIMRYKAWPYFPAWREIFGKDRATGDEAEDDEEIARVARGEAQNEVEIDYVPTADWNPDLGSFQTMMNNHPLQI
ncbi:UNVERIFIED_CONTAM: hypothetical protein Sangu_0191100 [Sesamum angustifolium]|uniref:Myb/SANT-like domain-containing protein n=1 Tax=Sesamum angustifolium TaxID=2727405 RepID=A0AAW2RME7_9LAMI